MANPITIEALQAVDAINRRGSFAGAADELFKVPSAISYTVQKLEQDLGVQIFNRSGHRAVLTPAGEVLLEHGRSILAATLELADTTQQVASGWESSFSIAIDSIIPLETIYPMLERFNAHQSSVEINLYHEVLMGGWDSLTSKRADLVIGVAKDSRPAKHFKTLPLAEHEFVFVVSPQHPLSRESQPLSSAQIENYTSVAVRDSSRFLPPKSYGILERQKRLTVPDINSKILAQQAGLGVGYLPRSAIRRQLAEGSLVELTTETNNRGAIKTVVAWRSDHDGRALKWFTNQFRKPTEISRYLSGEIELTTSDTDS